MKPEFSGIERRLDELNERLARLEPFTAKKKEEFERDPYLRDIVERNMEVAVQCCIDMGHRIIALEKAQKPRDYYETFIRLGELRVLPTDFVREFAPVAGFRNILAHEYLTVDWNQVYKYLQRLDDFLQFAEFIRKWLKEKA